MIYKVISPNHATPTKTNANCAKARREKLILLLRRGFNELKVKVKRIQRLRHMVNIYQFKFLPFYLLAVTVGKYLTSSSYLSLLIKAESSMLSNVTSQASPVVQRKLYKNTNA